MNDQAAPRSSNLLRNFAVLAGGNIGVRILGLLLTLVLARRLGVETFGRFNFAQAIAAYFFLLADFGLSTLGVRDLAIATDHFARQAMHFFSARLLTGAVAGILLAVAALVLPRSHDDQLLLVLFWVSLFGIALNLEWVFRATERMGLVATGNLLQNATTLALAVALIQGQAQLLWIPVLLGAGALAGNAVYWAEYTENYGWPRLFFEWKQIGPLLRRAGLIAASTIMIQIYYTSDTLLLGLLRSDAEVGWYNGAYRLVLAFTGLAAVAGNTIFPRLARLGSAADPARYGRVMRLGAKILILCALPISLAGTWYSEGIVEFLYGQAYLPAAVVLRIIIWQAFTVFANVAFAYSLLATDNQRLYFYSVTAGAGSNLLANLLLIPQTGMLGAAIATILAEIVVLGLLYWHACHHIAPVPIRDVLAKAFVAAIVFLTAASFIRSFWLGIPVSTVAYIGILWLLKPFDRSELDYLIPRRKLI